MNNLLENHSHKRYNILTGEWVLVSPHRTKRPWLGQEDKITDKKRISYDSNCYLCPTNKRANRDFNPKYNDVFVFENDFAALEKDIPSFQVDNGLLQAKSESGICKVVCYSPNHSKTMADLTIDEIENVISIWQREYINLGKIEGINYIQIFENKGELMGASNPHPHGQIWAQNSIPNEVIKKDANQKKYFEEKGKTLLEDYISQELDLDKRKVFENNSFVVLIPFWAVWPYEAMIIPKKAQSDISLMNKNQKNDFAEALKQLTMGYDKIFNCSFPYSAGIHQAPTNNNSNEYWHWHMSFYPPLLRSATVKKFMVGYEMFAMPQRDITAESAAKRIKELI